MTDSMVERVARAIEEGLRSADAWPEKGGFVSTEYGATTIDGTFKIEIVARAVIEAMRDVDAGTPEMLRVGKKSLYSCSSDPELEDARQCWQAMIDAALQESSPGRG